VWRALFDDDDDARPRALAAIEQIAGAIRPRPPTTTDQLTLVSGVAGVAVLHAYLVETGLRPASESAGLACVELASDGIAALPLGGALWRGFTGIGWLLEYARGRLVAADDDDPSESIDEALLALLAGPEHLGADLMDGLAGVAAYAFARLPRPAARQIIEAVVARLARTCVRDAAGLTWFTPPEQLPPQIRTRHPHGMVQLGVAHGTSGAIAILGRACGAGIATDTARALLDDAVAWLLAHALPDPSESRFPFQIAPGEPPRPANAAWCMGDPGIAVTLLAAARGAGNAAWEDTALVIGRKAATRSPATSGVRDAGLCHGAAGLAHMFHRLYHATNEAVFAEAARDWFSRTLAMQRPEHAVAGFPVHDPEHGDPWVADPGLLYGAAGVGLALAAAISDVEPTWDQVLLLDVT
jgi:lantibiotic biosynthesis protein